MMVSTDCATLYHLLLFLLNPPLIILLHAEAISSDGASLLLVSDSRDESECLDALSFSLFDFVGVSLLLFLLNPPLIILLHAEAVSSDGASLLLVSDS
mmetsp:Transcript_38472/g.63030  ORF Transcript_38472/g.63030 Transcript_38472/m.63030 type:complete len:98 (+) Transcript_38472:368-661(+)